MAIKQSKNNSQTIELDTKGILNLRFYVSKKSTLIFVNGFCFNMITKETDVIYTNGAKGVPMTIPVVKFKENFIIK